MTLWTSSLIQSNIIQLPTLHKEHPMPESTYPCARAAPLNIDATQYGTQVLSTETHRSHVVWKAQQIFHRATLHVAHPSQHIKKKKSNSHTRIHSNCTYSTIRKGRSRKYSKCHTRAPTLFIATWNLKIAIKTLRHEASLLFFFISSKTKSLAQRTCCRWLVLPYTCHIKVRHKNTRGKNNATKYYTSHFVH